MATIETTRAVNLAQLSAEMGGKNLSGKVEGATTAVTSFDSTTQAALQAAVDAHVAVDERANRTTIEQQAATALANNKSFLAIASPTTAQITAQVKALTRQNNALIRLALGRLDGTD